MDGYCGNFFGLFTRSQQKIGLYKRCSHSIDRINTFDGDVSNYSRKIKSDNPFVPDRYEKIPLEIRIVK